MSEDAALAAREIRVAVGRLSRQLRRLYGQGQGQGQHQGQALEQGHGDAPSQGPSRGQAAGGPSFLELAVLLRLDRMGPCSPGALAAGERVTSQAVSAALAGLRRRGLVRVTTDPADRRRSLVGISDAGRHTLDSRERLLGDRLTEVVAASLTAAELRTLRTAAPLLDRLADVL